MTHVHVHDLHDGLLAPDEVCSSRCSGTLVIGHIVVEQSRLVEYGTIPAVKNEVQRTALRLLVVAAVVAGITALYYRLLHVNPTTVALTFLLGVLVVSASWGLSYAVVMAVLATALFNYFFLPPIRTWDIADPQNWVALSVFLMTAIIASQLSERARREASNADRRRREVERLYSFSQQLLVTDNILGLLNAIPRLVVESFGVSATAMFLSASQQAYYSDLVARSVLNLEEMKAVLARGEPMSDPGRNMHVMPLRMGVRTVGIIGTIGAAISRETLEAVSSLIATAVERADAVEKLSKTEAARESEQLRSALLDSVTHEFRTPLTGIKAATTSLLSDMNLDPAQRADLLAVINEESDRLNRLVGEATEVAQLDAGQIQLQIEPHAMREAVDLALHECQPVLAPHPVELDIPATLPAVPMDVERIKEVVTQLLGNAAKYSPSGSTIRITCELVGPAVRTSVADRGPGIDSFEQSLIFDKFYRGRSQRSLIHGTGMGLAIAKAIVEAHGGAIGVTSQLGHGSVFHFTLPVR